MKPKSFLRSFITITGSTLLAISYAHAADGTWILNNNGNWSAGANWLDTTIADGADSTAFFTLELTGDRTVTLDSARTIGNITFTDTTPSHNLTLSGANILTLDVTSGSPNLNVTQAGRTLRIDSQLSSFTTEEILVGDGLTKSGPGILILNNNTNNYSGKTLVNGGILQIGTAFNTGNNAVPGGYSGNPSTGSNLELNGGIVSYWFTFNRTLGTGDGQIQLTGGTSGFTQKQGDRTLLTFNSAATEVQWGSAAFSPSTLVLNDSSAGVAAPIRFANLLDLNGANRTVAVNNSAGNANLNTNPEATAAFSRVIDNGAVFFNDIRNSDEENAAGIVKNGVGILGFNGTNTYDGGTTVNQGGVFFNNLASMPASGAVSLADGTALAVTVGGTGKWTTDTSGEGSIGGILTGLGGQSGSTVSYAGAVTLGLNVSSGTQTYAGDIANVSGSTSTGIAIYSDAGSGVMALTGNNSYTGPTRLRTGILEASTLANAGSNSSIGAYPGTDNAGLIFAGGTLRYTGATDGATNRGLDTAGTTTSTINIVEAVKVSMGNYQPTANLNPGLNITGAAGSSFELARATLSAGTNVALNTALPIHVDEVRFTVAASGLSPNFGNNSTTGNMTVRTITNTVTNGNVVVGGSGSATITESVTIGTGNFLKAGGAIWIFAGDAFTAGSITINGGSPSEFRVGGSSTLGTAGTFSGNIGYNNNGLLNFASSATQTLGGIISSATGRVSVTGAGTLILNGNNTYDGATTVTSGKLFVNGNQSAANGAVSVAADATLGGTGTIGGNVTIAENGKLEFNLSTDAASHDKLDLGTGNTLTFSGASKLTITSTGGASTGLYTLVTAPGGIIGSAPSLADVTLPAGWTASAPVISGNDLQINITSTGGGGASPYESWAGLGVTFDGDANGDGVSNGLAFLLGAAGPNVNAVGLLPTVTETGGGLVMTFSMLNAASRGTAALSVEHSSDLGISDPWTSAAVPETSGGPTSGVTFSVTPGSPSNSVTATILVGGSADGKLFGRLKATE
jgi:autotransporter-associated beta strand protein